MTSDNVIEFPSQDLKLANLKEQLTKQVGELEFKYSELDTLHEMLNMREAEANKMEKAFDIVLKTYVDEVGIENVPALWLSYSRSCAVKSIGEGEYRMIWLGTDLDEE